MKFIRKYSRAGLIVSVIAGVALAILLCVQCVRTYQYVDRVLVLQEASKEADRQAGALVSATRSEGETDPHALGPVLEQVVAEASDQVIWMRLMDQNSVVLAEAGAPQGPAKVPPRWRESVQKHENVGRIMDTARGKAMVTLLPFRIPRQGRAGRPDLRGPAADDQTRTVDRRPVALILEVAIPLYAVSQVFSELRQNLVSGMLASLALLVAMVVIGIRGRRFIRAKYLAELELARRVQHDLLPQPASILRHVDFASAAVAADHVGGDFHDIFETDSGRISLVLGDVSGKGVSAALLASVIHGAIRTSSGSGHESSCERINRMLCEKSASERFATLFWGVFDPLTATLRYVNAGHAAPVLLRARSLPGSPPQLLDQGGPVLGILPTARYSYGTVQVTAGDTLIVYSDGVSEAANPKHEEFGDDRVLKIAFENAARPPREICEGIMAHVAGFSAPGHGQDDRTLMVVRFLQTPAVMTA